MRLTWIGALGALLALAGCGGETPTPANGGSQRNGSAGLRGTIQIDGSSTVYLLTEAVAEEFQKSHPGVRSTVGISGTGGGFKKFSRGETAISNASRPIKAEEASSAREKGVEFVELPVAYDALSVVVNPHNTWATSMTVAELRRIWEPAAQGRITRWSQVRPGWPDRDLRLYGPGSDSGTFDYFTDAIAGEEGASRGDYTASEDDNVLVQGVSRDVGGLGYFGLAYYLENQAKLKAVPVDDGKSENGAGPQAPSPENVSAGTYQPLSRPLLIYVAASALDRPEVRAFLDFYLERAPELAREVGYIPLPERVRTQVGERLAARTTGSLFEGGSQVGVNLEQALAGGRTAAPR